MRPPSSTGRQRGGQGGAVHVAHHDVADAQMFDHRRQNALFEIAERNQTDQFLAAHDRQMSDRMLAHDLDCIADTGVRPDGYHLCGHPIFNSHEKLV